MKNIRFSGKIFNRVNLLFLTPLFLIFITIILVAINLFVLIYNSQFKINNLSFKVDKEASLPQIKLNYVPKISAKGAIIMDADSKVVLYAKNPDLRFSSASTTKIMTALTALDHFKLNEILTVKQATNEGSVLGLREGDQLTFENLLYAMLLPSANDAALTISENFPGGKENFINKMNKNTEKFNLSNTHYSDPTGLVDVGDYTTPFDLARLASFAIQNEKFKKVVGTKKITIYDTYGNTYLIENLNKLLGNNGVTGIKTGYTEEAGQVLVTSKMDNDKIIVIVVMGSEDRFSDTLKLIDLINNNLTYLSIHP